MGGVAVDVVDKAALLAEFDEKPRDMPSPRTTERNWMA